MRWHVPLLSSLLIVLSFSAALILEASSWDVARLTQELRRDKAAVYQAARLAFPPVPPLAAAAATDAGVEEEEGNMCGGGPAPAPAAAAAAAAAVGACGICGEPMLPPIPAARAAAAAAALAQPFAPTAARDTTTHGVGNDVAEGEGEGAGAGSDVGSRALPCASGHVYCVDCWTAFNTLQIQEGDGGGWSLRCPGVKCGEVRARMKQWCSLFPALPSSPRAARNPA